MTEKLQVSKKLDDGTIVVVGGDSAAEFAQNLADIGGETLRDEVRALFYNLIPASGGSAPTRAPSPAQAEANVRAAFPDATNVTQGPWGNDGDDAPGFDNGEQVPLCNNHRLPAKFVPAGVSKKTGRSYSAFYSCAQGDRSCRVSQ